MEEEEDPFLRSCLACDVVNIAKNKPPEMAGEKMAT